MDAVATENGSPGHDVPGHPARPPGAADATTTQIRGSSLLLAGRVLSVAVNVVIQVVIVRSLSKTSFGAFAYALSLVTLGETITTLGLDRAVTRFLPIYEERGEYRKMAGTMVLVVGSILSLGLALVLVGAGLAATGGGLVGGELTVSLLAIMIVLAPVQALDNVLMGMFAVYAQPRAIFFRKHLLEPGLRLIVVLTLIAAHTRVTFLAAGYVAAGVVGAAVYTAMLVRLLRRKGLSERFRLRTAQVPVREILAFTLPLLSSDILYGVMNSVDAVLLERYRGTAEVGAFRVVQPAARMNQMVMLAFTLLFTPLAARLFARRDREGLDRLYWQTAIWMAILSFPIFAATFSLARPVTVFLFGERYAGSAAILSLLSLGYYASAALGFNGLTLKVVGKLRLIVAINALALVTNVALNLILIPRYGAVGAAVGTAGTLLAHNLLKQIALRSGTGIALFHGRHATVYATLVAAAALLLAVQLLLSPPFVVGVALAGVASLAVLAVGRHSLAIGETFPELLRFPIVRRLLGKGGA